MTASSLPPEILQRQRAEQELRESEARVRAILDCALSAVIVIDADGTIIDWNAHAEAVFGWTRAEALGQLLAETIIPPRYREAHDRGLNHFLATGEGPVLHRLIELTALRRDGDEFPVELSISPLKRGDAVTFCGFITDISQRKRAEAALQAQLARLKLLDHTTRAIGERQDLRSIFQVVIRSLEDHLPIDFGCVCLYDSAEQALTVSCVGTKSRALAMELAMPEQARIAVDQNGLAQCVHGRLVYERDTRRTEFPLPQRLASAGLCSLVVAPLIVERSIFGVMLVARREPASFEAADCEFLRQLSEHVALAAHQAQLYSALQRAYHDLRQTQQTVVQQERLGALGQMASGIAHDINNALSPAALYIQSLRERDATLSDQAREYLAIIQRALEDVAHTVARMREFYRPNEPQLTLLPVNLNSTLKHVIDLTRARWSAMPQERGVVIRMQTDLAPALPAIMGAESEIRDALTNLILNAVDAMPAGGTLTLRSRVATTQSVGKAPAPPVTAVHIEVCDTGIGMDEHARSRCLEPFFTTKGERGTGLGLAMVYGMVQRHGAEVEIDSEPGKGTTVRLIFASLATAPSPSAQAGASPRSTQCLRILLVDDDPLLLQSLRHVLEDDGHVIAVADGGQAGINSFQAAERREEHFAAVITDLGMPYVDGRQVARAIKQASPRTPVILLTGWGHRLLAENEIPDHVDRVLGKPPRLAELRMALAELTAPCASDALR